MSALRLAARLARREVRRRPWRTLLVALLVAVPVAGMVSAAALVRTGAESPDEAWQRSWGAADAVAQRSLAPVPGAPSDAPPEWPPGSRVVTYRSEHRVLRTLGGVRVRAEVSTLPVHDPMTRGLVQVREGRLPAAADEVFLTEDVAERLGVRTGDEVRFDRPAPLSYRVVGVGEKAAYWGSLAVVLGPGAQFPWRELPADSTMESSLVDLPGGLPDEAVSALATGPGNVQLAPGLDARVPAGLDEYRGQGSNDEDGQVAWSWVVGALVLLVAGIVIASAFTTGARRQLTTLGQLAANGAGPRVLRDVLVLQGTWAGLLGAVLGLGLGGLALLALAPHVDRIFSRDVAGLSVEPVDLLVAAVLGVVASTLAAGVPARSARRIPVLAALAGRRPLRPVPGWLPAAGAAAAAAGLGLLLLAVLGSQGEGGAVWVLTAILGGTAVLLGACAVAPAWVSLLEPAAARLAGTWRLAARGLARERTRTSAVVSAVCAAAAMAIGASAMTLSFEAVTGGGAIVPRDEVHVSPFTPAMVDKVLAVLPGSEAFTVSVTSGETEEPAAVYDAGAAGAYRLDEAERRALERVGALRLVPEDSSGESAYSSPMSDAPRAPVAAAMVRRAELASGLLPTLVVTPEVAQRRGMAAKPSLTVVRAPGALDDGDRLALATAVEDHQADLADAGLEPEYGVGVLWHTDVQPVPTFLVELLLAGLALIVCLFVVAASLALTAAESRAERELLAVVGAPPAALARTSGKRALLLVVLGVLLAVPAGFLPAAVFVAAAADDTAVVFPWRVVGLLLVAVPVLCALVTTGASTLAQRARPVAVSTLAFD